MLRRWLALAFLLYVALDFANPMIPGAVTFDPDDTVEAVRADGAAALEQLIVIAPAPAPDAVAPARLVPLVAPAPRTVPGAHRRFTRARRVPPTSRPAPPGAEDH